jgi:DNA polymerase V
VVDEANRTMGRGTLRFAAKGISQPWKMKRGRMTLAYTSDWGELPEVI